MHSGRMEVWKCMADDKREAFLRNHEWGLLFHNNNVCSICHHTLHSPQYADYGPIFRHICIYRRPRMQKYNKALYLDRHGVYTKKIHFKGQNLDLAELVYFGTKQQHTYVHAMFYHCMQFFRNNIVVYFFFFSFLIVQSDDRITHQFAACLKTASKTKGRKSILYINRQ